MIGKTAAIFLSGNFYLIIGRKLAGLVLQVAAVEGF